jgi:hypothetical protein
MGAVRLEWSATSGGPLFAPFLAPHAATLPLAVWSGQGPGWGALLSPPTADGRVVVSNSTASPASFAILPLRS